jgi:hypothetical protein
MDRWEAVRGLKNEPQTRDIPIIGMAAHALDSEREHDIAAGCDEFDVKPDGRIAGLSALENLRITITFGAASGCRLASTRCPIAEPAVGRASSTPILLAAYPL